MSANYLLARDKIASQFGPPLTCISEALRGLLVAAPGHTFLTADFNAIEARVLAWLAGEEKVLDIFRAHGKIYEHNAATVYRCPLHEITKEDPRRQIGKVATLALGYQGGVGAFQAMAKVYGLKIADSKAEEIKVAWREGHPFIVKYWFDLESAALLAVKNPGEKFSAGHPDRRVTYSKRGSFLFCKLPSGRFLSYPYPTLQQVKTPWGQMKEAVHYKAEGLQNKWEIFSAYGGHFAENCTQAVARDLLAEAMVRLEAHGYPIVLHAHDEAASEVKTSDMLARNLSLEGMCEIMSRPPEWAAGLPLKAAGWQGQRYRK